MHKIIKNTISLLIIGDEILSGFTQDKNTQTIINYISSIGLKIKEIRIIPDCKETIQRSLEELMQHSIIITSGGLGLTHDDYTSDIIAKIYNTHSYEHHGIRIPKTAIKIRDRFGFIMNNEIISLPGTHYNILENLTEGIEILLTNNTKIYKQKYLCLLFDSTEGQIYKIVNEISEKYKKDSNKLSIGIYSHPNKQCRVIIYYEQEYQVCNVKNEIIDKIALQGIKMISLQENN